MARLTTGERVDVRLPQDMLERIAAIAPGNKRAQFIREAVAAELDRRDAGADSGSIMAALAKRKASRSTHSA